MEQLFKKLVSVPSPSGREKEIAEYIHTKLDAYGWDCNEVNSGKKNDSTTGVLLARNPKLNSGPVVLLVAHMDTVETGEKAIIPVKIKDYLCTDGTTILGADNKTGVTILLTIAQNFSSFLGVNVLLMFTTREEKGQMGSSLVPIKNLKPNFILNIDGSYPPGHINNGALGQTVMSIECLGTAAHAASAPKSGKSAIHAMATLITLIQQYKKPHGTTLNVGTIQGGKATNIVPDYCTIMLECRGYTTKDISNHIAHLQSDIKHIEKIQKVRFFLTSYPNQGAPPWHTVVKRPLLSLLQKSAVEAQVSLVVQKMTASSDANYLGSWGIPTININHGGQYPHTTHERISIKEIESTYDFVANILKNIKLEV